jgi:hypothetical protein
MAVAGPITCGKNRTSVLVVSCGEFWVFLRFLGLYHLKSLDFLTRKHDDFGRKIVVKTW